VRVLGNIAEANADYLKCALERVEVGNIFDYPCPVIPIKTKGRVYGQISQQANALGIPFPNLSLGCAELVVHENKPYIMVAFWEDQSEYTEKLVMNCVMAAMHKAALAKPPMAVLTENMTFSLLGGKEFTQFLPAMEIGVEQYELVYGSIMPTPDVTFVTNKPLT